MAAAERRGGGGGGDAGVLMWPCVWPSARRRYPRLGAGLVRADATKEQIEELASDMMMEEVFSTAFDGKDE